MTKEDEEETIESQQLWVYQQEPQSSTGTTVQLVHSPRCDTPSSAKRLQTSDFDQTQSQQSTVESGATGVNYQYIIPYVGGDQQQVMDTPTVSGIGHSLVVDVQAHSAMLDTGSIVLNASINEPEFVTLPPLRC